LFCLWLDASLLRSGSPRASFVCLSAHARFTHTSPRTCYRPVAFTYFAHSWFAYTLRSSRLPRAAVYLSHFAHSRIVALRHTWVLARSLPHALHCLTYLDHCFGSFTRLRSSGLRTFVLLFFSHSHSFRFVHALLLRLPFLVVAPLTRGYAPHALFLVRSPLHTVLDFALRSDPSYFYIRFHVSISFCFTLGVTLRLRLPVPAFCARLPFITPRLPDSFWVCTQISRLLPFHFSHVFTHCYAHTRFVVTAFSRLRTCVFAAVWSGHRVYRPHVLRTVFADVPLVYFGSHSTCVHLFWLRTLRTFYVRLLPGYIIHVLFSAHGFDLHSRVLHVFFRSFSFVRLCVLNTSFLCIARTVRGHLRFRFGFAFCVRGHAFSDSFCLSRI